MRSGDDVHVGGERDSSRHRSGSGGAGGAVARSLSISFTCSRAFLLWRVSLRTLTNSELPHHDAMATGPLRFRTPHIEELPISQSRQSAGFAWVAVSTAQDDPAKNSGTTNRKRARASLGGQTEQQKEALSARVQRETERKIKELNSDNSRDVVIDIAKKPGQSTGGALKAGKTTGTKKILASGKTFAHYLDDEEAEIARTGRRDGDADAPAAAQRASKTPLARRKPRADSSASHSPAPLVAPMAPPPIPRLPTTDSSAAPIPLDGLDDDDDEEEDDEDRVPRMPTSVEMDALLNAPPLTYNQARSAPPPAGMPPPRRFCETCGYWGRVRCLKCGAMTCSVLCKDEHDQSRCLKMYA